MAKKMQWPSKHQRENRNPLPLHRESMKRKSTEIEDSIVSEQVNVGSFYSRLEFQIL